MRGRTLRVLVAAAAGAVISVVAADAASAGVASTQQQPATPTLTSPAAQSGVTQGEAVAVVGDGCPPDAEVAIEFDDIPVGTTVSDASGAFSGTFTVPIYEIPDVEEGSEASVAVVCGGQRASVVVAVNEVAAPPADDPVDPTPPTTAPALPSGTGGASDLDALPRTGAGPTVALSALGVGLVAAGTVLAWRSRAGRAAGAG